MLLCLSLNPSLPALVSGKGYFIAGLLHAVRINNHVTQGLLGVLCSPAPGLTCNMEIFSLGLQQAGLGGAFYISCRRVLENGDKSPADV